MLTPIILLIIFLVIQSVLAKESPPIANSSHLSVIKYDYRINCDKISFHWFADCGKIKKGFTFEGERTHDEDFICCV